MSPFETKAAVKRAAKKEAKLARREERASAGRQAGASSREPTETPTLRPIAVGFGSFERHTTGFGSVSPRCLRCVSSCFRSKGADIDPTSCAS